MRGFSVVGLINPKSKENVGSVLRACGCFEVSLLLIKGRRYSQAITDPQKVHRRIPLIETENVKESIPYDCVPVAVEILEDAKSLKDYKHPERAFYLFGPEDGNLPKEIVSFCRDKVFIPTKYCLNLASCVNIVLYDRMIKNAH